MSTITKMRIPVKRGDTITVEEYDLPSGGGGSVSSIGDIGDVDLTSPSDGEVLKYNNTTKKWENDATLALGETSSTAYRGDRGKTAYNHASAKGSAFSSGLYKITTNSEGHVTAATAVAKADITGLGIPGSDTNTHRPIQVNDTEILGNNTTALNLKAGSNVTLSNSSGTVTIAATDTKYSAMTDAEIQAGTSTTARLLTPKAFRNNIDNKTWIGTCSTAAATAAKVVTVDTGFLLVKGARIGIKFTNTNTAENVTLNVNSTGAKSIYYNNAVYTSTSSTICGYANRYNFYIYDGTNWVWDGYGTDANTTYSAMSSSELTTGTATTSRVVRADYLKSGIDSLITAKGYTTNTGTVTKVSTGAGLTGGDVTTTGTIKAKLKSETKSSLTAADKGSTSGKEYAVGLDASGNLSVNVPWTDTNTKVTTVGNHYAPAEDTSAALSADASSSTAATWGSTDLVTGVNLQRDAKGHVVGLTVDSIQMPANPNSNTIPSAYCSTAAATAAKTASCSGYALLNKSYLHVIITNSNTSQTALTLNVNSKGAKPIYINGSASSTSNYTLPAGSYLVYYNGTNYYFRTDGNIPNTQKASVSGTKLTINSY